MMSFFKKRAKAPEEKELKAFLSGKVIPIEEVPDEVFSAKILGDGVAILPESNQVLAPVGGEVAAVMQDSKHACGIKMPNGLEVLIHVGLDTVDMNGDGFQLHVKMGDTVKCGDPLITFDPEKIKAAGHPDVTILVITNNGDAKDIQFYTGKQAVAGETVIMSF